MIGIAAASAMSRFLTTVLFGVSPADPIGLRGAALCVICVALATDVMAAWPALHGESTAALRSE